MLDDIRLQNFRSYNDSSFEFNTGVNIIVGPNGSGKTNLLEAIMVVCVGRSYRVYDTDLIEFKSEWSRLEAHTSDGHHERIVKLTREPTAKTFEINNKKTKRLGSDSTLPIVVFEPNHLQLIHGSPDQRRNYLDDILDIIKPGFSTFRNNYKRVLQQRNSLLKKLNKPTSMELFPWDLRLSELGAAIVRAREDYIKTINPQLSLLYKTLSSSKTKATIKYKSQFPIESYESHLLRSLEQNLSKDILRGFTTHGPHRDDFNIILNNHPAQETASRGETRTTILALKIIELKEIERVTGRSPILLLDDVFSELDGARRRALTSHLHDYQTFITTTDADVVIKHFTNCSIIPLS